MKKLRLVFVGNHSILTDCILLFRACGHEVISCFVPCSEMEHLNTNLEVICHELSTIETINHDEYDYCIVLDDIILPESIVVHSNYSCWIKLKNNSILESQQTKLNDLFYNYTVYSNPTWYFFNKTSSCFVRIKQTHLTLTGEQRSDLIESLHYLMVDLSRDTLEFEELLPRYAVKCSSELTVRAYVVKEILKTDIKMIFLAALHILTMKYVPFKKDQLKIGISINKQPIEYNLLKRMLFIENYCNENDLFAESISHLFKSIVTAVMCYDSMTFLDKNNTKFEASIGLSTKDESYLSTCYPSLLLNYDLKVEYIEIKAHYVPEIYSEYFVKSFLDNYVSFLGNLLNSLNKRVVDILLPIQDKHFLKQDNVLDTKNVTVLDFIEKQVKENPKKIAVVDDDRVYSYQELHVISNYIAAHLSMAKVAVKGQYIPLIAGRSFALITGLLGIMKAGACYVPINPKLPREKIQYIAALTKATLLLSDKTYIDSVQFLQGRLHNLVIENLFKNPQFTCDHRVHNKDVAYVIFTSGTTGVPKGVVVDHSSLLARMLWLQKEFSINQSDAVLQHTNIGFDVSIEELFIALISGGKLVFAPDNIQVEMDKYSQLIKQHQITYIEFVSSILKVFLELNDMSECKSLRYIISGGEALSYDTLRVYHQLCNLPLVNFYGPTECTINATYYVCSLDEPQRSRYVPIGSPLDNVDLFILDQHQNLVPEGGTGELYIGGSGLSRGYLKEHLILEDCCIKTSYHGRLYKTGDLVRYIKHNVLEYIGRIDRQVKIRGYRIELEEIEIVLSQYPGIKQAIVLVIDKEDTVNQLLAFVQLSHKDDLADEYKHPSILKKHCENYLPDYMIPNTYMVVDHIPVNQNGKINYSELKRIFKNNHSNTVSLQFGNELEKLIQEIWASVLNTHVGLEDNYFDLGGNSLSSIQTVALLNKKNVKIEVSDIFKYPTIKELVANLNTKTAGHLAYQTINPITHQQQRVLSYAQQRLWYLYVLEGEKNSAYNIAMTFHLSGHLEVQHFNTAINKIIERHEILRTTFKSQNGTPWQQIHAYTSIQIKPEPIEIRDLEEILIQEIHLPFDIEHGPLYRIKLYQVDTDQHILSVTMHNIITDGWSESIILHELNTVYNALVMDEDFYLEPLRFQYSDFSYWQKNRQSEIELKDKIEYWVNQLSGCTELQLYLNHADEVSIVTQGKDIKFHFENNSVIEQLNLVARNKHTTPYVVLVTAFNLLLTYYSNQNDIVIGTGMAGRDYPGLEKLIGFFVNTVVLRSNLSGNLTISELIERIKTTCIEAHQYQDVPFEMIVDALQLEREDNKNPIFQVLFIMQKTGDDVHLNMKDIKSHGILVDKRTSTFDITFNLAITDSALTGDIQYSTSKYSYQGIQRFADDFYAILKFILLNPDQKIHTYNLLNPDELNTLLQWNNTEKAYPNLLIHQAFEHQVKLYPMQIAAIYLENKITYQELNQRANQLAHYLIHSINIKNKASGNVIGISTERNINFLVCLLAILKSGNIFSPLDPEYPLVRLKNYIDQAKIQLIICDQENKYYDAFSKITDVVHFEAISKIRSQFSDVDPDLSSITIKSCYVIFTSGSTGNPKGVLVNHSGVMNLLYDMQNYLQVKSSDSLLSLTSINFDICYLELFLPLISGARCILADKNTSKDSQLIKQLVEKAHPTIMQATPSFWNMFVNDPTTSNFDIKVLTGGELLTSSLAARLIQCFKEVWNVYGPTETTIWSTIKRVDNPDQVTIGVPVANTKCYVLNENRNPVPINVPGELYLSGAGLSAGYLNNAHTTSTVFLPNPFAESLNTMYSHLYKTGDLVRYLSNGELQYLGRHDQQVKIRGHRIELTEITNQIANYPGIYEATVIVHETSLNMGEALIAFYTIDRNKNTFIDSKNIQAFVMKQLPNYMVPNKWIRLDEIPKTLNGKIDYKKLKDIKFHTNNLLGSEFLPPNTQLESQILSIWSEILNLEPQNLSINDSFFMIGGHSLLIPQVIYRMNAELSAGITIRSFIQNSTIERLAHFIEASMPSELSLA